MLQHDLQIQPDGVQKQPVEKLSGCFCKQTDCFRKTPQNSYLTHRTYKAFSQDVLRYERIYQKKQTIAWYIKEYFVHLPHAPPHVCMVKSITGNISHEKYITPFILFSRICNI